MASTCPSRATMPSFEGVAARRAALQMLDAVLRRGQTLEAASGTVRNLSSPDHALAVAIAGEALRRLPDLDALIDGATRQRLPDDSKARMVLRLALAQKVGLWTPHGCRPRSSSAGVPRGAMTRFRPHGARSRSGRRST